MVLAAAHMDSTPITTVLLRVETAASGIGAKPSARLDTTSAMIAGKRAFCEVHPGKLAKAYEFTSCIRYFC